jgi:ATP-dependent DNA helicase DinG
MEYSGFVTEILSANSHSKQLLALVECESEFEYLAPATQRVKQAKEKILITAAKKNLQKLPPIADDVSSSMLRERFSYVCLRKYHNCLNDAKLYLTAEERMIFFAIITWAERTKTGDLNEVLHYNRNPILWKKVACEAPSCLGEKCEHFSKCHFQNAKKAAENSNLLIVPHQLFLQNMQMDFVLLPHCEKIIFDDAGKLLQESKKIFGRNLHFYILKNSIKQNIWCKKWEEAAAESEKLFLSLLKEIQNYCNKEKKRRIIYSQSLSSETGISAEPFQNSLKTLIEIIEKTSAEFYAENDLSKAKDCMQFASDIRKISSDISFFFAASHGEFVYWVENSSNPHQVNFRAELVNISAKWKSLYSTLKSALFVSDTLSINGQFEYLINRFGLFGKNPKTKIFSPKTKKEPPQVFAADFLPKPTDEKFTEELTKTLCEIISKNKSNTLIFTDMASISKLHAELKKDETLKTKTCFFQGADGNFYNLAGFFQKEAGNVLVGTPDELKSLEDIELPENTLVVISRLPFPDIKEPVIAKQMEILKEQNKNGFLLITFPETALTLRKAYAAISRSDKKQTLLFLDPRIASEAYGAKIQKFFPNFKILSHRVFSTSFLPL